MLPVFTSVREYSGCVKEGGVCCCLHKRAHISFFSTTVIDVWPYQTFARIMITALLELVLYLSFMILGVREVKIIIECKTPG